MAADVLTQTGPRLALQVGGRPHRGTCLSLGAAALRELCPGYDAFLALRDRLDPQGLPANDHLDHVLGRTPP